MTSLYSLSVTDINGNTVSMETFKGKTLLIVNTASKCGFTYQYEGLEKLYQQFKDKNFVVLGFPCNQFGAQEPGNEAEIKSFCDLTYRTQFPMFSKVDVNGENALPLFEYLKSHAKGILGTEGIKWNFTKFLVSKTGDVVSRFAPQDKPESLASKIEEIL